MSLILEKKKNVAYVTIDNPAKANILDRQTSDEISEAWKEMWEDRNIRAIILTGSGDKYFCAGHYLAPPPTTYAFRKRVLAPFRHRQRGSYRCFRELGRPLPSNQ